MLSKKEIIGEKSLGEFFSRAFVYTILIFAALYFLIPFFIMFITSIKTMDDIRTGHLISWPHEVTLSAWRKAWESASIGVYSGGIKKYFWNSVKMVLPAVGISTIRSEEHTSELQSRPHL